MLYRHDIILRNRCLRAWCSSLIESGLWSKNVVERQMSHQERNSVRASNIHKAEHLDERSLMLQWWADFLDANRRQVTYPFDYAK